MPAFC